MSSKTFGNNLKTTFYSDQKNKFEEHFTLAKIVKSTKTEFICEHIVLPNPFFNSKYKLKDIKIETTTHKNKETIKRIKEALIKNEEIYILPKQDIKILNKIYDDIKNNYDPFESDLIAFFRCSEQIIFEKLRKKIDIISPMVDNALKNDNNYDINLISDLGIEMSNICKQLANAKNYDL